MSIAFLVYSHLIAGALGAAVAALLLWRPKRRHTNFAPSYFKGSGEPRPFSRSPDRAVGHSPVRVYPSVAAWAKANGVD